MLRGLPGSWWGVSDILSLLDRVPVLVPWLVLVVKLLGYFYFAFYMTCDCNRMQMKSFATISIAGHLGK